MSEKKNKKCIEWEITLGEVRSGAVKYVDAITKVFEGLDINNPMQLAKEAVFMGYATGVILGKFCDVGIEGFTLMFNGIRISLEGEDRKEKLLFAIWDREGNLHTSEEGFRTEKGGKS